MFLNVLEYPSRVPSTSLHRVILFEQRLCLTSFVWKLAPLADERSGFFKENLLRRLMRSSTYLTLQTRIWHSDDAFYAGIYLAITELWDTKYKKLYTFRPHARQGRALVFSVRQNG
jgi:hypothetical protein